MSDAIERAAAVAGDWMREKLRADKAEASLAESQGLARLFAAELRDRQMRFKIDRHGNVFGQLCAACSAEDAQPHAVGCIVGMACGLITRERRYADDASRSQVRSDEPTSRSISSQPLATTDSERLDWLAKARSTIYRSLCAYWVVVDETAKTRQGITGATLREAIDRAIAGEARLG